MPNHHEDTVDQIAKLYDRHAERTTRVQRIANRATWTLGSPMALLIIFGVALAWVIGNTVAHLLGSAALEQFPFPDLGFLATIAALLVALLILTTQRHEEARAENRAQLTLHVAMLSERKIAKVIELLEAQRRDNPLLPDRHDQDAAAMAQPGDHETVLGVIDEATLERRRLGDA